MENMKKVQKWIKEFKDFAAKGDAISLAIGVVIGGAFKGVIDSLVNDIIMPPISFLTTKIDFSELFFTLGRRQFETIEEAKNAGAITITYGNFINQLLIFTITSLAIFITIFKFQQMLAQKEKDDKKGSTTRKCPYCFSEVNEKATRCPHCTSTLKAKK